jgi:ketosteroid isomerase-like protein
MDTKEIVMASTLSMERSDALRGVLAAAVTGDATGVGNYVTKDVIAWSPNMFVTSMKELVDEIQDRDGALSNIEIVIDAVDVVQDKAIAEWSVAADHTGTMTIDAEGEENVVIAPTNQRVFLAGASFAEFEGDRICALRTYFDDAALLEQLLLIE